MGENFHHIVYVNPDGSARSVYKNDLQEMFEKLESETFRVTNVEFNNVTKMWTAYLPDGTIICEEKNRETAIKKEIEYLDQQLQQGNPIHYFNKTLLIDQ